VLDDLEMVRRLKEIRMLAVAPETPKAGAGQPIDVADTDVKFAKAFREYGIDIATLLPEEAAGRIVNRTIRQ